MLKLTSNIQLIGSKTWEFSAVHNCAIVEDTETLTDTCELELPKNIKWEGYTSNNSHPPIKRGDKVIVKLGYDGELKTRFVGYVRSIDAHTPVRIKCEDGMFLLKQTKLAPKSFKSATLEDVISYLIKGTGIEFKLIDKGIKIGKYRIVKPTVSEELQELKEKYLLSSYFRNIKGVSTLYVGLKYPLDNRNKIVFKHSKNIISEDLEYRRKEDIRVKVEAVSFGKKHKKTTLELGDKDGDVIKIRIDGLTEGELKKYANQALERYKISGFKGTFETFGSPEVSKGDMVEITASDGNYGTYLVEKVEISFGVNGYRQTITLGQAIS
ncbi:hypothetical protein PL373_16190 [Tenacibaculum maritimum]|nr:hypothetical protein [Tenacibaculum maritimum]MDB0602642.1 hypothetical protein [Tenacibaculum maritimum]MDB0611247.1 hypothetical protein [Tenacibaculum maritimum]